MRKVRENRKRKTSGWRGRTRKKREARAQAQAAPTFRSASSQPKPSGDGEAKGHRTCQQWRETDPNGDLRGSNAATDTREGTGRMSQDGRTEPDPPREGTVFRYGTGPRKEGAGGNASPLYVVRAGGNAGPRYVVRAGGNPARFTSCGPVETPAVFTSCGPPPLSRRAARRPEPFSAGSTVIASEAKQSSRRAARAPALDRRVASLLAMTGRAMSFAVIASGAKQSSRRGDGAPALDRRVASLLAMGGRGGLLTLPAVAVMPRAAP